MNKRFLFLVGLSFLAIAATSSAGRSTPPQCCKCVFATIPGGGTTVACQCTFTRGGNSCEIDGEGCITVGTCSSGGSGGGG